MFLQIDKDQLPDDLKKQLTYFKDTGIFEKALKKLCALEYFTLDDVLIQIYLDSKEVWDRGLVGLRLNQMVKKNQLSKLSRGKNAPYYPLPAKSKVHILPNSQL